MQPSHFQEAIFEWVKSGQGHAVVDAVAGAGKTTTLVELLKLTTGKIQFLAFNKHIADELQSRVPMMVNVNTTNSFGNRVFRDNVKGARFNKFKTWDIVKDVSPSFYKKARNQMQSLVGLYKASFDGNGFADPKDLVDTHGILLPKEFPWTDALEILRRAVSTKSIFDFDDQIFMPVYFKMEMPKFDWVCIDEAQDLNPVQQVMISRILTDSGRLVAVGDPHQAIYGFRGADVDSINTLIEGFSATVLPLSVCYRCAKNIVDQAKNIVPHIESTPTAQEGVVKRVKIADWVPSDGTFVLCRTTAPLVRECLRLISKGRKATVKGRDIGEGLLTSLSNANIEHGEPEFMLQQLNQYRIQQMARLKDRPESVRIHINDIIDTLVAIIEFIQDEKNEKGITLTPAQMIDRLFSDTKQTGVLFSTIHRSKGEEYDEVHIIRPDLLPHPKCMDGWQYKQEMNLKYVAITRAKQTLVWVDGEQRD